MVNKKSIVLAKNAPDRAFYTLENMGYCIIESAHLKKVQPPLAYHPDMQIVRCSDGFVCAPECYSYYRDAFAQCGVSIVCGETEPGYDYPSDIAYNVAVTGKYAIHNFHYTEPEFLARSPYTHIWVKQGYSKCSVCIVGESAIITADKGIAEAADSAGMDVLLISAGYVTLPGYDYGFIGGASGLVENGLLYFCGDIATHPDYANIAKFCKKYSVELVSLWDGRLVDVGTIIPLG